MNGLKLHYLDYGTEAAPSFAEAWISIAIGLILLFATYALRLIQFLLSPSTFTWNFSDEKGQPIKYTQTVFIWGDAAMLLQLPLVPQLLDTLREWEALPG